MYYTIVKSLLLFLIIDSALSQPNLQFNPFDWITYRKTGAINSISFGDRYAYIGTQTGGVLRFNINSQRFEAPITRSQGLDGNMVTAVHYSSSGMLWVSTLESLQYSLTAEGDWRIIKLASLGIANRNYINRIGDDGKDIWIDSSGILYRLDGMTGIVLETVVRQDRAIAWSSGLSGPIYDYSELLFNYTFLDGWMNSLNTILSPDGENIRITTLAENNFGHIMIGCEDGTFFFGDKNMRMLEPYRFGLASNDVFTFDGKYSLWLGGRTSMLNGGLTYFDSDRNIYDHYYFDKIINLNPTPIFSSLDLKKDVLFGGEEKIIMFNKKDAIWDELYIPSFTRKSIVIDMVNIDDEVWLATANGLMIINTISKKFFENDVTDIIKNIPVYDLLYHKNLLFIATNSGIYIYDNKNDTFYEPETFGYTSKEFTLPSNQLRFTSIAKYRNEIYLASQESIIKFNFSNRSWSNAVSADIYSGLEIKDIDVHKNIIFVATVNGLIQYDIKDKIVQVFDYKFLGEINTMKVKASTVWLGTSEGMISYRYR